jgi:hypothetical protein
MIRARISGPGYHRAQRPASPGSSSQITVPARPPHREAQQGCCARPQQTACGFICISPRPAQAAQPVREIPVDPGLIAVAIQAPALTADAPPRLQTRLQAPSKKTRKIISGPVTCYLVAGAAFEPATSGL